MARRRLRNLFWLSHVSRLVVFWLGSAFFIMEILQERPHPGAMPPSLNDLAAILFGASSVALIIFSLLVSAAALIEWRSLNGQAKRVTDSAKKVLANTAKANQANEKRINALEEEIRGRVDAVMGAMIGTLHSQPDKDAQREEDRDYIAEAIHHVRAGYERLKSLEGTGKYVALNNLVYFTCLQGDKASRDEMLEHGRELLKVGRESRQPSYAGPYLMTYCRVVLVYSSDRHELEKAKAIAQDLTGLTKLQKREATYLVASLSSKLNVPVAGA